MQKRFVAGALWGALFLFAALGGAFAGEECTTAVITGEATADRAPILWKNRDTDTLSNKVVFVNERPFSYLGLVNAEAPSGRIVWGGLNQAGFAIINSVAYNLPQRIGEREDDEGLLMANALRTCATVDDFEAFIKKNLGPDLGAKTNFGVIDARGGAAIFEVHNHGFNRLNACDTAGKLLLNTNFSRTGTPDQGAGYLRFDREEELFAAVPAGQLSTQFILQTAARDLGHPLVQSLPAVQWKDLPEDKPYWIHANYTINRISTASVVAIQGVRPGDDPRRAVMWVILGEPVCSIAVPLWVAAGDPPAELREGRDAPIGREASRLKDLLRPLKGRDRKEYVNVVRLDNRAGSGWLPANLQLERQILQEAQALLTGDPTNEQLATFQKQAAARVLARLKEIK
ncbi:MAG: hypothetical protein ACE15E_24300 [Acidobacteriota bacterium]